MLGMDSEPGIYLQTLTDLFRAIEETRDAEYSVSMSYLEVSLPLPQVPFLQRKVGVSPLNAHWPLQPSEQPSSLGRRAQ